MSKPFLVSREDRYPLSAAQLWELVGNTEHVNRLIGLPDVTFGPAQDTAQGLYRPASARMLGLRLTWREYPFDWVRDRSHAVLRVYENGPLQRLWLGVELADEAPGCRLRQFAEVTPRRLWPLAGWVSRRIVRQRMEALHRFCLQQALLCKQSPEQPFPRARPTGVRHSRLAELAQRLLRTSPADPAVVQRLQTLLAEGSDEEVLHMRPFALARRWALGRDRVLRTFLHATTVGLLELDWELMCPNCRVPKAGFKTFGTVTDSFHCDLCGTDYAADLDRTTELRFSVHSSVRHAEDAVYCIGGPHNAQHILLQQGLRHEDSHAVLATLPAEPLRVRVLRLNRMLELLPDPAGPDTLDLNFDGERWQTSATHFRPGPVRLSWQNQSEAACTAVIEKEQWDPDAATAARVMAIPEFRALFSSEVLQPGRQIGIRNLCVLFTDLKGSTALYEKVGDAPAYGRVHRHFDFLIDCFTRHEGGIVKTIGDAVMASFPSPECALRAALEVQQHVAAFNARLNVKEPIVIKIGLHHGPAIAVNANGQMDYFGRTVNIAARIQGLSEGGDVVLSAALWSEPRIQEVLQGAPFAMERFSAELKGIAGTVPMCRLTLSERPPVAPEAEAARRAESPAAGGAAAPAAGAAASHGAAGPSATPRVFRY